MSNTNLTLAQAIARAVEMGGGEVLEHKFGGQQCLIRIQPDGTRELVNDCDAEKWNLKIYGVRPLPPRLLTFDEAMPHLLEGKTVKAEYGMGHTYYTLRIVRTDKDGKDFFGSVDMRTAKQSRFYAPEENK